MLLLRSSVPLAHRFYTVSISALQSVRKCILQSLRALLGADLAAREREIEQNAERVKLEADARVAAAERDKAEAEAELLALRDEAAALRARVAQLEKVKITSGLAAKIQKVVQERDELLAAARKGGRFNDENAAPFGAEDLSQAGGECRQS